MANLKKTEINEKLNILKRKQEEESAQRLAGKHHLSYMDLHMFPINSEIIYTLAEQEARQGELIVLKKELDKIIVGVVDPESPSTKGVTEKLSQRSGRQITMVVISPSSFKRALKFYQIKTTETPLVGKIAINQKYLDEFNQQAKEISELGNLFAKISTTEILDTIFAGALKTEAGDIHIEPGKTTRLRYRIDGVLQDITSFSENIYQFLLNRVKLLSGLKINVHDIGQDGRFTIQIFNQKSPFEKEIIKEIETRVSILPQGGNETIVIRLLGVGFKELALEYIGLRESILEILRKEIQRPNGLVLNTGPTGSGKTTTLYAFLSYLNNPKVKIITVEDPIEYRLPGIVQTQISENYTFAEALRSILRQNPNIIMIGEIRDEETAKIAIESSATGHLVFSTLHTNDAAGTINRLIDLGANIKTLPDSLALIIAQRLLRRLCPQCKEEYEPDKETAQKIEKNLANASVGPVKKLYKSHGCKACFGLKYKGRLPVFEIMTMNEEIKNAISNGATSSEIKKAVKQTGMVSLLQDGLLRAIEGETSLEEVERVAGRLEE
ncbi:MAG: type II/IV secretion system protein [Candidatus Portnoybacteria bacterium]|nr:type II/IV secretion system protein [Candidatus Portnoybacteria bacterium]